eukprot:3395644-Rhodomonas_salina.4
MYCSIPYPHLAKHVQVTCQHTAPRDAAAPQVVCDLGAEGTGIGISVIDPELLDSVRTRMPVLEHRRYVSRPLRAA